MSINGVSVQDFETYRENPIGFLVETEMKCMHI